MKHLSCKGRYFWLGGEGSCAWQKRLRTASITEEIPAEFVCNGLRTMQKESNLMPEILLGL
jgi:hypothetical protein